MTSLTAIFGNTEEELGDSEKLLELYRSRAELKKEFTGLRDESLRLKEQITANEGSTGRVQQKLDHLESLLLDPDWMYNVVVYYQLRAFNQRCTNQLARFAEQLKQQREQRQHSKVIGEWSDQRDDEAQTLQSHIAEQRMHLQMLEDQLLADRHRLAMMGGFTRFLRRRAINKSLGEISSRIEESQQRESELLASLEEIKARDVPDTEGLDIANKRSINFMILSFAQQMYVHFSEDNLAGLAKEAGENSVGASNYGTKAVCDSILKTVQTHADSMENLSGFADILQRRAKMISEKALFNLDDDAVPIAGTVSTVFDIDANGLVRERDANLIEDNYWKIAMVFSR